MAENKLPPFRDLGLTYEEAAHGVQSVIAHEMGLAAALNSRHGATEPKHLRVGVDMRAADAAGLARLLIDKGLFTLEEYIEYMRLAANEELARRRGEHSGVEFL